MKLLSEKEMIHQFLTFLVTLCFLTFVLKKKKKGLTVHYTSIG